MRQGYFVRADAVWPARVLQPPRPPALVYLDLNIFINLAKVARGTAPDGYAELLDECRAAKADGRAVCPLSATHAIEIADIGSYQQRSDITTVMEELSDFKYLLGRPTIIRLEVDAALDDVIGAELADAEGIPLIGDSVLWGFGMRGGLTIQGEDAREAEQRLRYRLGDEKFERMMAHFNQEAERALLTGPDEDTKAELRRDGYAPERPYQQHENRAEQERGQAAILDANPEYRGEKLRDLMNARETLIEFNAILAAGIYARNTTLEELFGTGQDVDKARDFNDSMPSTRVAVSLKAHYHRDGQHQWTSNDIHDIDALAVAVPYCDAVFTDKAAWNALKTSRELDVFNTELIRRPQQLTQWLRHRPK